MSYGKTGQPNIALVRTARSTGFFPVRSVSAGGLPQPTPGLGEVLLQVRAIAVNRTLDCEVRSRPGAYGPIPMPHISGAGPAGEVAQVGEGVQAFHPGDWVVSFNGLWCGACRPCVAGQTNACVWDKATYRRVMQRTTVAGDGPTVHD